MQILMLVIRGSDRRQHSKWPKSRKKNILPPCLAKINVGNGVVYPGIRRDSPWMVLLNIQATVLPKTCGK